MILQEQQTWVLSSVAVTNKQHHTKVHKSYKFMNDENIKSNIKATRKI